MYKVTIEGIAELTEEVLKVEFESGKTASGNVASRIAATITITGQISFDSDKTFMKESTKAIADWSMLKPDSDDSYKNVMVVFVNTGEIQYELPFAFVISYHEHFEDQNGFFRLVVKEVVKEEKTEYSVNKKEEEEEDNSADLCENGLATIIEQAKLYRTEAESLAFEAGLDQPPKKTIAFNGEKYTHSGWRKLPKDYSGFTRVDPVDVIKYSRNNGYKIPKAKPPFFDHNKDGWFLASHAEKQLATISDEPIGISNIMCDDCQKFFMAKAKKSGKIIVTADPDSVRVFNPDGCMHVFNREGTKVIEYKHFLEFE
jgi:hypothetical protein